MNMTETQYSLHPLTSPQREIWYDQILHEGVPLYNIGGYVKIPGVIDTVLFEQAVNLLVQKHDTLRTMLTEVQDEDGVPMQTYAEKLAVTVPMRDFSTKANPHEAAMAWMQQRFIEPFELMGQPLFRYDLVKISDDNYYWLLQYHHLIIDGYGVALLNRSLAEIYTQLANEQIPNLDSHSYISFIENDRAYVESAIFDKQRQYWLSKYPTPPEPLLSPRYRSNYTDKLIGSDCEVLYLPRDFYNCLNELAKQHDATLFHLLLGALYVYFTRTAQRDDFAIGLPVLNRANAKFKKTAGLFTGVSPTLFNFGKDLSFAELLQQINKTLKANYRHQRFPVSEINREVGLGLERSQLFDINLSYENHDNTMSFSGINGQLIPVLHHHEQTPLMIFVRDFHTQHDIEFDFVFNLAYFNTADIKALQARFVTILKAVLKDSISPIYTLPIMTEQESWQLQTWNDTATDFPKNQTIIDLFEQQVEKTPDNIAVVFETQELSYEELNRKANQVAHYLMTLGVKPEVLVGICIERSIEMVIGLLGILKAGGAYVPIDPSYPPARISYMLEDSATPVLLTQNHLKKQLPELKPECVVVYLDEVDFAVQETENPDVNRHIEDLAYVIYTSGSTGKPKGTLLTHKSLSNYLQWAVQYYSVANGNGAPIQSSIAFDATITSLYLPLIAGKPAVLLPEHEEIEALATILQPRPQFSLVKITPAHLEILNQQLSNTNYAHACHTLILGGEALTSVHIRLWLHYAPDTHLINEYGPTESVVGCCIYDAKGQTMLSGAIPIGQPISNTRIYILDATHQPQPPNIPGELCIAGAGLARGYLNRPELTAEKFIEVELFGKTERIYKTGDLARWLPDGNLEYLGRIDNQVKLRGFRIELGEIEAVLSQHETVKEAVVTLYEADDNKRLVAYLKVKSEKLKVKSEKFEGSLFTELKEWLKTRLPDYMVPSHFTVLDKLPLTPNGKIDRKALPAPELNFSEAYEAPRNDIEQQLAQIWSSLLKLTNISIHDNFFSLGGDSILSIQIVARARQAGLHFTPRDLFEHQTIAELAMVVDFGIVVNAEQGLVTGESLLTPIQHWFFAQDLPEYWHFNQSILLRVAVDLEVDALRQALAAILSHHDALRLRYHLVNGDWQQSFAPPEDTVPLSIEDLSQCENPAVELQRLTQSYQTSLNLTDGPLTHLVLFKLTDSARLFWCIHHLVVDGVSWRILQEDLQTAYTQIAAGKAPQLPAKTSSFKAWAEHLIDYATSDSLASESAYWQALPTLSLPVDNLSGLNRFEHHKDYTITLNRKQTEVLLRSVPKAYNTHINDVLLTALALALAEWTKKSSCLIDLEGHGRADLFDDIDLSRTVGWFTTIHPIAFGLPSNYNEDLGAALKAIKEQLRAIPSAGIGYGLLTQIGGNALPKGDILFNYLGQFDQGIEADFEFANETTGFDVSLKGKRDHLIDINGAITKGKLSLNWSYSGDCYIAATIKKLAEGYKIHLQDLINHCQSGKQGVTPSDFPLAPVLPLTLDALYTQYSGLQDLYPLSHTQQGMLFHALYEPETGVYFEQMQLTLSNLEPTAFKAAWQYQLERHPILRSAFLTEHEPVLQVVQTEVPLLWREHDWREMSSENQDQQLSALLQEERSKGFDLNQAPLMRFDLIRLDEQRYEFIQHHHHILMDGWCLPITFSEVRDSYLAFKQGKTPQLSTLRPYRDYIAWLQQQDNTKSQHYWQQRLAGFIAPTMLPIIKHKAETTDYREASYCLDVVTSQQLQRFCKEQRVTLNTLVQGAYALLLSRYSRETDICFGVTVSGRNVPLSGIEQMIGLFINTLPLRIDANSEYCVKDYLQQVQTQHQNDNRYAHSPLFEIQKLSDIPAGTALFESLLVFENYPLGDALEPSAECYQIEDFHGIEYTNYPLTLAIIPGEVLGFKVSYDNSRISQDSIERLCGHLNTLLGAIVENPEQSISQLPMLTENEVQQLQAWNDTATDFPKNQTIVDLFEQQVEKTPENIAVVFETQELSYEELNKKANQVAYYLMTLGVKPEVKVGICVERSIEMVIGLLGILKAGGAYVPIDPSYPPARISYMLEDSATSVLLTQNHLKKQLPELKPECVVVCLDEVDFAVQETENPDVNRHVEDLAYVIYTSGSTGKPKGVMVECKGLVNLALAQTNAFRILSESRILQFASISFDASVSEITTTLLAGAALYLVPKAKLLETANLMALMIQQQISHITLPPSFLSNLPEKAFSGLKTLVVAGEACSVELIKQWANRVHFINAYGPTENTICASMTLGFSEMERPHIGQPIANTRIYILDAAHQPQPPWIPGELCIAGAGLARGYLNRPELTAEKFIEVELFGKIERIYKTGDLARWLPDGNLEYLGRIDNQVKLRGFRIELGEIEAVLSQHSAVKEAVVTLYEADDNKRLVAYFTTDSESNKLVTELKNALKANLPDYMVPSHFTVLDKLPLTPNGKIDRKALPAPELNFSEAYEAPRNDIEQQLAQIWSSLLKLTNISIHDNFFSLGGDSILSIQIVARARQAGLHFTPRDLFEHQTIAELAMVVSFGIVVDAEPGLVTGESSLTPIQHWFFAQDLPEYWHFNQSILLRVAVDLEVDALRQALAAVLSHHDALRLRYHLVNGDWQQSFAPPEDTVPLSIEDLSQCENPVAELQRLTQSYQTSLNLTDGPLTHLVLFLLTDSNRLFWCIHHLVVDGVSWRILQEDLQTAYTQIAAGKVPQLPAKTSSFKVWAERLKSYAVSEILSSELADWQALPTLSLPVDNLSGLNRLEHHKEYTITLNRKQTEALLRSVPKAYNTQINDVLLTALALTLAEWTQNSSCLIDLEGHGRVALFDDIDLSRTVGWFTTIHPLALRLPSSAHDDLGAALKAIKEQLRVIPSEGIGYGLLTQMGGHVLPKGDILFNYLGQFDQGIEADFEFAHETTGFDVSLKGKREHLIDINGAIMKGQLSLNWSYSGDCYIAATIKKLAEGYKIHLQDLIYHCQSGKQGVTPSDFPLAPVLPSTLDALYTQYSGLQDLYPLSPMQQGMLFHALYEPSSGVYFEQMQLTLSNLEPTAFKAAWQHQLERHSILRTAFLTEHQPILQVVQTEVPLLWREHDWREMSSETQDQQLSALLQEERSKGFDLNQAPLMRFDLIRLDEQRYEFIQHHHHILMDGWCLPITFSEVRDSYLAFKQGKTPQLSTLRPYRDYIAWLQQQDNTKSQHYWQQRLAGFIAPTMLPIIKHKAETTDYREASYCLDVVTSQQLQRFCKEQRVTLNTLVQGAYALLLSRYSRETDICFGVTVSGRNVPLSGIEQMIGLFINTLPLRIDANSEYCVKDYLQQVQTQHQNDNRYAHSPLFEIQTNSDVPNGTALFESLLVFENYPLGDALAPSAECYQIEDFHGIEYTNYPLTLAIIPGEVLGFKVSYDNSRISQDSIERLWGHLNTLLGAIVENPEQSINQLPMLTENEVQQLQTWNDTVTDFPKNQTIVDLFEQQVEKTPDNIAVVFETQELSYEELNKKANQVAHYLMTSGVKPEVLVGICVERSIEMVIGLLGILKAGGAYVPIDPSYPPARISYMLEDSATPVLLTQNHLKKQLPELKHECVVVCLDEVDFVVQETENPDVNRHVEDLAYIIYTSGSTGRPKGTLLTHKSLSNYLQWAVQYYSVANGNGAPIQSSIAFDATITSLYLPLIAGKPAVLLPEHEEIEALATILQPRPQFSLVKITPAHLEILNQQLSNTNYAHACHTLILGGEALTSVHIRLWLHYAPDTHLINEYGPTESVVGCCIYDAKGQTMLSGAIPIGQPIANTRIYILDAAHQPQPPNIPGELCIAGVGLARGYLNRPEQTAEKFIEVKLFGKTERIYKTGDKAQWLPDGNLEYLGRIDNQVKLRGFRIELGEIETVLSQHSAVKEVVVTLYEADDNKRLAAYFTTDSESNELVTELKNSLKASLPDYMVPSYFTMLDKLPLTPNGKIDRKALPAPEIEISTGTKPATPTEELLAGLMAFVLKCEAINRDDNFFELGGHSLLATQLIARIRDSFQIELPVRAIFEHPQLSTLAKAIETATGTVSLPAIEVQSEDSPKILSYAQQRLWFLNQFEDNGSATYNMPAALLLSGELNLAALQQSLHWLQERHASLRTYFPTHAGKATAQIQTIDKIEVLRVHDLRRLTDEVQNDEVQNRANSHALTKFDLATGPLFKAELLQLNETQSVLLLNMHHIISDGWSMGVFIRDWQHAYTAFAQNAEPSLVSLTIQYSDYAAWQRDWLTGLVLQQQVDYWRTQLAGIPELLELPTDKPRPPQQSYQGAHYAHNLSATLSQSVTGLSQQQGVTVFMTLLASFNILLSRYSRQNNISVGSPIANRTHSQTEDIIGFFVNTLVLHSRLQPQQSFIDLLLETRQTCLEAYAHQDIPFEMLVEQLQPTRSLSHHPLFQVMLVLQNNEAVKLELPGLDITTLNSEYPIAKFDLTLNLVEQDGQFECVWEYATDLFGAETIERMAGHFEVLLTAIVENPEQSISQLPMLTENEVQQLQTWNDTVTDFPKNQTIVDLFEQQVEKTPDNIAVVFETQELSYEELNKKANQVAHYLMTLGVKPEVLVGICVERSIDMVIGLLGILKAGGAYVPIDPSYPPARISYMLEDSATPVLLTQNHLKKQLPELKLECVVVCLDEVDFVVQETENPDVNRHVEDLAYVIYTSGSTGKPKGVSLPQAALVNLLHWQVQQPSLDKTETTLQFTSLSFDVSFQEIFSTFFNGGQLVLVDEETRRDASALLKYLSEQKIERLFMPYVMLQHLAEHLESSNHDALRLQNIITAGEQLHITSAIHSLFKTLPQCRLYNQYGPSESHVVTAFTLSLDKDIWMDLPPIGQPIANTRIYILDAAHQPQSPNIPGELCIAGAGLARGYLNRPKLTAEKFIEVEIFGKTERIYKTGDLARWLPDGNLEYLGRIDNQVKLRGFRIELGEIEAVLSQHSAVKEVVVTLYEADDNKRLVAYLKVKSEKFEGSLLTELKEWLKTRLPDYMVPSHFTVLDKLPLTPNGKIDRKALPAPDSNTLTENTLPRDAIELQLLSVWETVLDVHLLGIHDNFFELGGHSLLAVKLMSHIQQQCGVRLPVSALFQNPTIATLAQQLRQDTTKLLTNLVPIQIAGEKPPVYCLPGAIGSVMYLYPLASYLGQQQPFYALQTPGLEGEATPETVAAQARYHLQALRQQQPSGPYQLMGHSSGGRVAFEMAWQLEQQGETVAFLGILDTSAPDSNQPNLMANYTELNWLSDIVLVFEELVGVDLNCSLKDLRGFQNLAGLPDLETAYAQVMQAFVERQILFAPGAPIDELKALVNTYRITVQGHANYQIPGKVQCPIHLFRSSEKTPNVEEIEFEETREAWGWAECTHAKVEEFMVPGTHVTMMALPHVRILAEKLSAKLSI